MASDPCRFYGKQLDAGQVKILGTQIQAMIAGLNKFHGISFVEFSPETEKSHRRIESRTSVITHGEIAKTLMERLITPQHIPYEKVRLKLVDIIGKHANQKQINIETLQKELNVQFNKAIAAYSSDPTRVQSGELCSLFLKLQTLIRQLCILLAGGFWPHSSVPANYNGYLSSTYHYFPFFLLLCIINNQHEGANYKSIIKFLAESMFIKLTEDQIIELLVFIEKLKELRIVLTKEKHEIMTATKLEENRLKGKLNQLSRQPPRTDEASDLDRSGRRSRSREREEMSMSGKQEERRRSRSRSRSREEEASPRIKSPISPSDRIGKYKEMVHEYRAKIKKLRSSYSTDMNEMQHSIIAEAYKSLPYFFNILFKSGYAREHNTWITDIVVPDVDDYSDDSGHDDYSDDSGHDDSGGGERGGSISRGGGTINNRRSELRHTKRQHRQHRRRHTKKQKKRHNRHTKKMW